MSVLRISLPSVVGGIPDLLGRHGNDGSLDLLLLSGSLLVRIGSIDEVFQLVVLLGLREHPTESRG